MAALEAFVEQVAEAYSAAELDLVIADVGAEIYVGGDSRYARAQSLIEHFVRRGELAALVTRLTADRPNVGWQPLADALLADTSVIEGIQRGEVSGREAIDRSFETLRAKLDSPAVRDAFAGFLAQFSVTNQHTATFGDFKDVHDQLHRLLVNAENVFQQYRVASSDVAASLTLLEQYEIEQTAIVDALGEIARRPTFANRDTSWVDLLRSALDNLRSAIEYASATAAPAGGPAPAGASLVEAITLVRSVLAIRMSEINSRLNETAQTLQLQELVEDVVHVRDALITASAADAQSIQFSGDVDRLVALVQEITGLTRAHNDWQIVDDTLRSMELNVGFVRLQWADLSKRVTDLSRSGASWANTLSDQTQKLDRAVQAGNPSAIESRFRIFRGVCSQCFFAVDDALKKACVRWREISLELSGRLQTLQQLGVSP